MIITIFSVYLIFTINKFGFAATLCVLLGCFSILSTTLVTDNVSGTENLSRMNFFWGSISEKIHNIETAREFLQLYGLFTGIFCIVLGMIFAYKPSLIQVKNYLPFEYPYPIWNSKQQPLTQFNTNFVLAKSLLTNKEKMLSCRFKYLLIVVDEKMYLASPNEMVPKNTMIVRTKLGNTPCGISRI
ncbi:MAG: hypothetical protein HZA84_00780 [Thaumarchaeota archaeon]|nr:hypothetical protein [Nitrososphaerota archaeon]